MGPDAKSLIERARWDGPSPAQREQTRRNVKAALAGSLTVAGTSTAAATHLGTATAVHGLSATVTPLGLLGWLGAGSAVGALVLGGTVLVTGTAGDSRPQSGQASMARAPVAERRPAIAPNPRTVVPMASRTDAPPGAATSRQPMHDRTNRTEAEPAPRVSETDSLRAEYALLEAAHRALEQSDTETALSRLADHQRQFGEGRLAEERQGIHALATCMAGGPGAREQAAQFLHTYPQSLLGPRIRQQCHLE